MLFISDTANLCLCIQFLFGSSSLHLPYFFFWLMCALQSVHVVNNKQSCHPMSWGWCLAYVYMRLVLNWPWLITSWRMPFIIAQRPKYPICSLTALDNPNRALKQQIPDYQTCRSPSKINLLPIFLNLWCTLLTADMLRYLGSPSLVMIIF